MTREISSPVVLIHGFRDIPAFSGIWMATEEVLCKEAGVPRCEILMVQIPPLEGIKERSLSAISRISEKFRGRDVHLMGHSMGGLNARDIAGTKELDFRVLTVTTFGTPHYGVKALESESNESESNENESESNESESNESESNELKSNADRDSALAEILPALVDMKPSIMTDFNKRTWVNPDVKYFTWAGKCSVPTLKYFATWVVTKRHGATDGVVSVKSAQWDSKHCTQLGVMRGADHFTILRKDIVRYTIPHLKAAESGGKAPVVELKNDLATGIINRFKGDLYTVVAPAVHYPVKVQTSIQPHLEDTTRIAAGGMRTTLCNVRARD